MILTSDFANLSQLGIVDKFSSSLRPCAKSLDVQENASKSNQETKRILVAGDEELKDRRKSRKD